MNFWDSGLGKVIWRGWAIILGIMVLIKLMILVLWACIRHPLSDSVIDYERRTVYLKKNEVKGGMDMWTNAKDKLPKIIYEDGNCNAVLVWWAEENVGGFQYGISNTEYVNKHPETIICWSSLLPPPEELG